MKLNLNKPILTLDGSPFKEADGSNVILGKTIANALAMQSKGDILKFFGWAQKMYKGEAVEMDKSDLNILKGFIEEIQTLPIITKGQALEAIAEAEKNK